MKTADRATFLPALLILPLIVLTACETVRREDPMATVQPFEAQSGGSMGSLGLNVEYYLYRDNPLPEERIARLEKTVIALHRDVAQMAPAVQRMGDGAPPTKAGTKPATKTVTKQPVAPAASAAENVTENMTENMGAALPADHPVINDMRVGEHPGKTRIVFESTKPLTYRYDIDNTERLLVIELPGAFWPGAEGTAPIRSPLISSYSVRQDSGTAGGLSFIFQLKRDARLAAEEKIGPAGSAGYRLVLDFSAQ